MALKELPSVLRILGRRNASVRVSSIVGKCRRYASTEAAPTNPERPAPTDTSEDLQDLESHSSLTSSGPIDEKIAEWNPVKIAAGRTRQLPPSRYQFRPPRYDRGPLHPHQPPPKSDLSSREFVPGPFNYTRLESTYKAMIAPDLMTMTYVHKPPGTVTVPKGERLRTWDDSSPYHKGRPKRGPRGGADVLRLIERDINFRNIPMIEEVTLHSFVKSAIDDSAYLHMAGMVLQSISGVKPIVHRAKKGVSQFGVREGMALSLTCTIRGNMAYEFVDRCINLVLPRIKDWPGVKGTTGDNSGNLSFGFEREGTILFPEVAVNYDMYPPKMIPGFHVTIKTTATSDRHARLLLSAMGLPFYGKLVN